MLYLALILLTLVLVKTIQSLSASVETGRHKALNLLRDECDAIYSRINNLKEQNFLLEKDVSQTITLYDITKDISRELDQEKILKIFKERANDYMKIDDCAILEKNENADLDEGFLRFPLVLNKEKKGCLIASGVEENDRERFKILAQQLLITIKRSLLYKKIQELAIMDGLTRVFCRRHFLERLNEEVKRSKKFKHSFSFLMVDIDKFKSFNDKYGHLVGDAILREVSKTIKETIRQIDFVGRYGGEELSIVLPETDKEQALLAAERLRYEIEKRKIKVYDEELKVTISVGISSFPADAGDSAAIVEAADCALYSAKRAGRNKVCAYRSS